MEWYVETERLAMRQFTLADVELLVDLDSDVEVMRYLTGQPTPREQIADQDLPAILATYDSHPGLGKWAAYERTTGRFIGWFSLDPGLPGEAELGYRLRRDAWGFGYAGEGAIALVRKGFAELGLTRINAITMAVNTGSRKVMQKAGLRFVRLFHEHFDDPLPGTEHGEVEYEITR
ncbi:GNAT family N-acetyltransferase [Kribbella sp. NBC_01245]|uniref:GNAT family N-acetyltransferase n=1 Tax=Kribbella sp. NBC_01245 TaxID=2903578 RepID=UPI002E29F8C6|nr:GNAT family N-acetyltransferase [Kribbella sp. NBC_01245]